VALAPSLLHKSSMKIKRIKFGLAILGGMAAFFLALLALVFAPSLASAGKGPDLWHGEDGGTHSGHPNPAYFAPPNGNGPNNGPNNTGNGAGPCAGNSCNPHDDGAPGDGSWHNAGGPGGNQGDGQGGGQGGDQGNSPNNNSGNNSQGGYPSFFAGGYPGGGGGGGAPHDGSNSCSSKDKDKDEDSKKDESGKKACESDDENSDGNNNGDSGNDAGFQQLSLLDDKGGDPSDDSNDDASGDDTSGGTPGNTSFNIVNNDPPPGDDSEDDLPPVDPNCLPFAENCGTHGNPPDTGLTDLPNEVPEPLTLSLFAVGLAGAATLRRRTRRTAARPD